MAKLVMDKTVQKLHEAIEQAIDYVTFSIETNSKSLAPYIKSQPGCGKTEMILGSLIEKGFSVIACEPGLERPEKFSGLPDITKDEQLSELMNKIDNAYNNAKNPNKIKPIERLFTKWSIPELVCLMYEKAAENTNGVVCFMDDMHTCTPDILNLFFEILTHRSLSGHKFPAKIGFMFAGNDSSAAGAKVMLSAILNRTVLLHTIPDVEYWLVNYASDERNVHPIVAGFFNDCNHKSYFCGEESTLEAFATPRSWTQGVSQFLKSKEKTSKLNINTLRAWVEGSVGSSAANKFVDYYVYYRSIDMHLIFDKNVVTIPDSPMEKFAYVTAIGNEMYNRKNKDMNDTKSGKVLQNLIDVLNKTATELVPKLLIQISLKKENKDLNLVSGISILKHFIKQGFLNDKYISKITTLSNG